MQTTLPSSSAPTSSSLHDGILLLPTGVSGKQLIGTVSGKSHAVLQPHLQGVHCQALLVPRGDGSGILMRIPNAVRGRDYKSRRDEGGPAAQPGLQGVQIAFLVA